MKKIFLIFTLAALLCQLHVFANDNNGKNFSHIGFHKNLEIPSELQIKQVFEDYQKYSNNKELEKFLNLHDDNYISSDGYNKNNLKDIALESWKEYPDLKYNIKVLNVDVDIDNATVITQEKLSGTTTTPIESISGNGYILSEATAVYYLKRCSNAWKITSDFVINEKTSMRYGLAKYIPMTIDAPSIIGTNEDYTAILKASLPEKYIALISITNEPITYPTVKPQEVFRALKNKGVQERILHSGNGEKNENAVASVGIAKPTLKNDNINVDLLGIAFLTSRVNVVNHKSGNFKFNTTKPQEVDIVEEISK